MISKTVTIICPVRNEEKFIRAVIEDMIAQDYPKTDLEILFMDGMSTDSTKQIITEFSNQYLWIKVFDNDKKFVPHAMNEAIKKSKGEIIIRMDAHASFPPDYISKLVYWLDLLHADNVGGPWITKPSSDNVRAKAIALSLSSSFGVGNAMFRIGVSEPTIADTVPFGCYRKSIFEKIGYYDERLIRNQDIELNKRLKSKGGKIFLVPDVNCIYYARDTFSKLAENNFKNGEWAILTPYYTHTFSSLALRHFIPLFFFAYLVSLFPFVLLSKLFFIPLIIYVFANLAVSVKIALREKNLMLIPLLLFAFLVLHLSYGAGSIYGLWRYITRQI